MAEYVVFDKEHFITVEGVRFYEDGDRLTELEDQLKAARWIFECQRRAIQGGNTRAAG